MSTKLKFTGQAIAVADVLAKASNDLADLTDVYFNRGYDSAGADPIVDGDVSNLNKTAAEIALMITLAQQFANFLDNSAVTTGDYDSTLSSMRQDL